MHEFPALRFHAGCPHCARGVPLEILEIRQRDRRARRRRDGHRQVLDDGGGLLTHNVVVLPDKHQLGRGTGGRTRVRVRHLRHHVDGAVKHVQSVGIVGLRTVAVGVEVVGVGTIRAVTVGPREYHVRGGELLGGRRQEHLQKVETALALHQHVVSDGDGVAGAHREQLLGGNHGGAASVVARCDAVSGHKQGTFTVNRAFHPIVGATVVVQQPGIVGIGEVGSVGQIHGFCNGGGLQIVAPNAGFGAAAAGADIEFVQGHIVQVLHHERMRVGRNDRSSRAVRVKARHTVCNLPSSG